jgi:hypothetical protein
VNVQRQIARLESLLARIQRNALLARDARPAAEPRPETSAPAEAAPESAPPTDRAEPPSVQPAPASAEVAVAAATEEVEVVELEMADDELVELAGEEVAIAEGAPIAAAEAAPEPERAAPLANELAEEPAPESAPRPAAQIAEEAELEPPVKTPPPESGRQVVASPVGITGERELHDTSAVASLEPDLSGGPISQGPGNEPSAAQLGETVELVGADSPTAGIELLSAPMGVPLPQAEPPLDELELSLPQQQSGGGYDAELAPPSRAAEDLARHRSQLERAQNPPTEPPISLASAPSGQYAAVQPPAETRVGTPAEAASPVVLVRPAIGEVQVTEMRRSAPAELPSTFLELIDASLSIEA